MAEGLRRIGTCPRCGGALRFAADAPEEPGRRAPARREPAREPAPSPDLAPSQVLGIPRR